MSVSSSSKTIIIKRKKPVVAPVATMDFTAPDDKPTSLPPATLKVIADALARGEYLQEVDCYWNPTEVIELKELSKGLDCSIRDMRVRHESLKVADLPRKEKRLITLEEATPTFKQSIMDAEKALSDIKETMRERNITYFQWKNQPDYIEAEKIIEKAKKALTNNEDDIRHLKAEIKATKEWKPERRIVVSFSYNDHITASTITKIDTLKKTCPDLCPKLIAVVNMRKTIMTEMNKSRGNPMRNVYLDFNLTPMDYRIQASWVIHRSSERDSYSWVWTTHYLHITEYNLYGAETVEYKSKEQLMSDEEKKQAEEKKKRLNELKKTPYDDYFLISNYDIGRAMNKGSFVDYKIDDLINDEDWYESTRWNAETKACDEKYQTHSVHNLVATNVNHTDNTFTIIGYMYEPRYDTEKKEREEPHIKKAKIQKTITYPTPSKRVKTTQLQKDLKKLTQNYEIPE